MVTELCRQARGFTFKYFFVHIEVLYQVNSGDSPLLSLVAPS